MTPNGKPHLSDAVQSAIQSRHPGIAAEIEGAINTLRKLQELAGPSAVDSDPSAAARPAPLLAAGDAFGRYQIVRPLGRGAMGAVYLAYDSQLERHVALKTPVLGSSPQAVGRFFREARAAAQLRSPYTCPVYDVGEIGGISYLSMAFIDGQPLSRAIAERRQGGERAVARLLQKIARGLQKAHEQGIIHRDLKPDNIMVDGEGEPVVMDFGLARRLEDDVRLTSAGSLLGTPAYMSPEQVDGDPDKVGPASDIYSLGVVLYEMLTGRLPFRGSLTAILRQIAAAQPPPPPSSINPALPEASPLQHICLKMMARSPADRYPSMAAVVEALDGAFFRPPPPAVPPSLWQRLFSWAGGLFTPRTDRQPSAGSSPDRTLPGSGQVGRAEKEPKSAEQTVDLPRSGSGQVVPAASEGAPSAEQAIDLPPSWSGSD
jgi:serine/threonine protein kinase